MLSSVVSIILYKEIPSKSEFASFKQCLRILKDHDIAIVYPRSLDISLYKAIATKLKSTPSYMALPDAHFRSIKTYNSLMLTRKFYALFENYEYLLIYQLDAWVFRDDLKYWCSKGYAYIGAPLLTNRVEFLPYVGNGGFSLRHVPSFINLLSDKRSFIQWNYSFLWAQIPAKNRFRRMVKSLLHILALLLCRISPSLFCKCMIGQEDAVFAQAFTFCSKKHMPTPEIAAHFSFERFPKELFDKTQQRLPFGCHAFEKYDPDFWKDKITIE